MHPDLHYTDYFAPRIQNVSVIRCDSNGNADDGGTYLKISATRNYCKIYYVGEGHAINNGCTIRYQYRVIPDGAYSAWVTILGSDADTDSVVTGALVGTLSPEESYEVTVGVLDDEGYQANTKVFLSEEGVFMHRDGEMNSVSIGEAVAEKNTVTIAEKLTTFIKGLLKTKNIQCDGTFTLGGMHLDKHRFGLSGNYTYANITLPDFYESSETDPATASLSHARVGSISVSLEPYGSEYMPGAIRVELSADYWANKSLTVFVNENMVYIDGLTEPLGPNFAVNKKYVDDQIQMIKDKLGL